MTNDIGNAIVDLTLAKALEAGWLHVDKATELRADVARLEAERDDLRDQLRAAVENVGILEEIRDRRTTERDEARAELSANERSEDARLAVAEAELDEARAARPGRCGDVVPELFPGIDTGQVCVLDHGHPSDWHEGDDNSHWLYRSPESFAQVVAERDEWRAIAEDWRAATKRYDRAWIKLKADQDAMIEAAKVADDEDISDWQRGYRACSVRVLAAVDQTAPSKPRCDCKPATGGGHGHDHTCATRQRDQTTPSSPLETPQTADGGEAGVVEGAGGSEAAEAAERPELVAFVEDGLGVTLTSWQRDLLAPKPATMNTTQPPMPSAGSWLEMKRNA